MSGDVELTSPNRPLFSRFAKIAWTIPLFAIRDCRRAVLPHGAPVFLRLVFLAAVASPRVLFSVGTDLFRWLSLARVAVIELGGFLRVQGYGSLFAERPRQALTLPCVVVFPFGSPYDAGAGCFRPFLMQQFVAERAGTGLAGRPTRPR